MDKRFVLTEVYDRIITNTFYETEEEAFDSMVDEIVNVLSDAGTVTTDKAIKRAVGIKSFVLGDWCRVVRDGAKIEYNIRDKQDGILTVQRLVDYAITEIE
jgi:hypothetical protein